jgi:hydroxymethylpyrimidine/phosphomethylpyrimidine kinase
MRGRVLIVAGSDSGGGAGIQADLKTVNACGAFGATAITALTAQNTLGVHGVLPVPVDFVEQQIRVVLSDLGADVVKTGMLHDVEVLRAVARLLRELAPTAQVVVDPVMVAKGGASLLSREAEAVLLEELCPLATILTPNAPEAQVLTGLELRNEADQIEVGRRLLAKGAKNALLKGGHLPSPRADADVVVDILVTPEGVHRFESPRIPSRNTHGTGCTLASALAAYLARGESLHSAVDLARTFVRRAIETAPGLGQGHGPLNHAWRTDPG